MNLRAVARRVAPPNLFGGVFAHVTAPLRRISRRAVAIVLCVLLVVSAVVLAWPMDTAHYLTVDPSPTLTDRHGDLLHPYLNGQDHWSFPQDLANISPRLIEATIAVEDERFYVHPGVDPLAVVRAAWQNVTHGHTVSGASTITMQLVKLADGGERSIWSKARQAIQAVRLELRTDKADILEAYLNRAPYGMNLMGCEAAARRYFGRPASELLLDEAALLAALPKAPSALMPLDHPAAARARRDFVLARMAETGFINPGDRFRAAQRDLEAAWHDYPALAPHLAARYEHTVGPSGLVTTLEKGLQAHVAQRLRYHVARSGGAFTNGAVLVVDVPSGEVLAHAGSADFFDTPGGGQVDATRAQRSPGSTLKPFTYALAMEAQALYPSEVLYDGPLDYGLYNPANFDGGYSGLVTIGEALRASLNVPAITALERVGAQSLYNFLRDFNFSALTQPAEHYGLGLTLGSCDATLEQLAAAYTAIARLGTYRALRYQMGPSESADRAMVSPAVAAKLFELLEQPLPGALDSNLVPTTGAERNVAWKTGTSSDYRDAWAIAFDRQRLVAVWMGNNDSRSSPYLVGYTAALPLAGELFRFLPASAESAWPQYGTFGQRVTVCAVSGLPVTPACPSTRETWFPKELLLHRRCAVHQRLADGSVATRWPGAPLRWDLASIAAAPGPAESQGQAGRSLQILEPAHRAEFLLSGAADGDRIRLRSSRDNAGPVHWYVNDRYLGAASAREPLYLELRPGEFRVTCMGANGVTDSARFTVTAGAS